MGVVRYAKRAAKSVYANENCGIERSPVCYSTNGCNADRVPYIEIITTSKKLCLCHENTLLRYCFCFNLGSLFRSILRCGSSMYLRITILSSMVG